MKAIRVLILTVVLLLFIAGYFYFKNETGTLQKELSDFAVEDTASVTKIFLADKTGNSVTLEREKPGRWTANKNHRANQNMMGTLLQTLRSMEVRSPVAKAAFNNVLKQMAATAIKVEIYQNGNLSKTFYVGHQTQDHLGTYMYLQHSSVPFVMHIPGFDGFLTTRFIAKESEWILKTVFDYEVSEIAELNFDNKENPESSFAIQKVNENEFLLFSFPERKLIENASDEKIISYLTQYSNLNYEYVSANLPAEKIDSIKATSPFLVIAIKDQNQDFRSVKFFRKSRTRSAEELLDAGIFSSKPYDSDRFYIQINDGKNLYACQYYGFGKLFVKPESFLVNP